MKSDNQKIERMIRVNHAGEFGAKRIYEGQLAVLRDKKAVENIRHMKQQELAHLKYFENEIIRRHVRPTLLQPVWNVAGFALGAATALMGEKSAYACTVAVEEIIEEHYQQQLDNLGDEDLELKNTIAKFKAEETEHKDISIENEAKLAPNYEMLTSAVKAASRAAIWLSKRI